jgi:4-diphosphocytidyl-2-C-methyl-D-erythritol kinase
MTLQLRAEAQAKVNLALAVTGRRDDGYHTLRSVFLRLALHDTLEADTDESADSDRLFIDGEPVTAGPENLVLRAAALLRELIGGPLPALRFHLTKRIPAAAGLGGGSSDGAAALDLAAAAWGLRLHPSARLETALRLGADVPFFSAGHAAALVHGIGEGLQTLPAPDPVAGILLITPAERLGTASVFEEYDRQPATSAVATARVDDLAGLLHESIDGLTLAATAPMLGDGNDLWAPAARLSPALTEARAAAGAVLGHTMLLTGSGPTLFAIYPSEGAAARAAEQLREQALPELLGATISATATVREGEER